MTLEEVGSFVGFVGRMLVDEGQSASEAATVLTGTDDIARARPPALHRLGDRDDRDARMV